MSKQLTASILIIGNEILSGRVQDKNINFIANRLNDKGIFLKEVRIIPDIKEDIIEAVNHLRKKYNYLFTTGGIGPTHDDITTACIAEAFTVNLSLNEEVKTEIAAYYQGKGEQLNEARIKMAYFPEGAELIANNLTKAPGFKLDNVFVLAGIPIIMNEMFGMVEKYIASSSKIISKSLKIFVGESLIAKELSELQNKYKQIDIGSYPFTLKEDDKKNIGNNIDKQDLQQFVLSDGIKHATDIVFRGNDQILVDKAYDEFKNIIVSYNYEYY